MKSTTESGRDVPVSGQSAAKVPALYQGFSTSRNPETLFDAPCARETYGISVPWH